MSQVCYLYWAKKKSIMMIQVTENALFFPTVVFLLMHSYWCHFANKYIHVCCSYMHSIESTSSVYCQFPCVASMKNYWCVRIWVVHRTSGNDSQHGTCVGIFTHDMTNNAFWEMVELWTMLILICIYSSVTSLLPLLSQTDINHDENHFH